MKRLNTAAIPFALILVLAACSGSDSDADPGTTAAESAQAAEITIVDFDFSGPASASVGDTVNVTNEDAVAHTWTEVDGEFDSGNLSEGDSFEYTFEEAGAYEFVCTIHPEMTGSITVEG